MRDVKLINGLLWALNALLGTAILAFAWFYLLSPKSTSELAGFAWDDDPSALGVTPPPAQGDGVLKGLPNPLERRAGAVQGATFFKAVLKGTWAETDPRKCVAFIKSTGRNVDLVAFMGEEILYDGKVHEEYRGWKLVEVAKDRAVFSNGAQKETLTLDPTSGPGGAAASGIPGAPGVARVNRRDQAFAPETFKSRLLASADSRQVWGLDPEEIDWATQNADKIMDQDFQVSPYAGGGLKIENVSPGTIGAARGLLAQDIVKDVNGQPLASIADIKNLLNNPALRQQTGLRITVERAGKPVVIEYRALPR